MAPYPGSPVTWGYAGDAILDAETGRDETTAVRPSLRRGPEGPRRAFVLAMLLTPVVSPLARVFLRGARPSREAKPRRQRKEIASMTPAGEGQVKSVS